MLCPLTVCVCVCVCSAEGMPRLSYHSHIAFFALWLQTKTDWSRTQAVHGHGAKRREWLLLCLFVPTIRERENKMSTFHLLTRSLHGQLDGQGSMCAFVIRGTKPTCERWDAALYNTENFKLNDSFKSIQTKWSGRLNSEPGLAHCTHWALSPTLF